MKIVIAHYKYHIQGGPERYMFKFMDLARSQGSEIIPFSIDYDVNEKTEYSKYFAKSDGSKSGIFETNNKKISYLVKGALREFGNRDAYKKLCLLIEKEKPDVLYCLIPGQLTADIFKAAKKYNIPVILRLSDYRLICGNFLLMRDDCICEECIHGNYSPMVKHKCVHGSKAMSILRAFALSSARKKKKYQLVDAVITPSAFTKDKFLESGYFPEEKMFVNPTFIDTMTIEPTYNSSDYILCLGRFSPEKGFKYAISSLQYLRHLPVKIAITGTKEGLKDETKELNDSLGIEDKIIFTGFLKGNDLKNLIKNAIAVACPATWYENMPNVVLEAYAYGKPVIASNIGSLKEIIENENTGLVFEPKNPEEFAKCVERLYLDSELRKNLGKNARIKCEKEYSPDKHWQTFTEIFEVISKRRKQI